METSVMETSREAPGRREELRGQHLHFDCVSGIAGDMTLGALLALGVPLAVLREAVEAMGIEPDRLSAAAVLKGGVAAIDVKVRVEHEHHAHEHHAHEHHAHEHHAHEHHAHEHHAHEHHAHEHHAHEHHAHERAHDHSHTRWADIRARLVTAELDEAVRARALDMFERVARAEAMLHGTSVQEVTFHEVGAIDSIVDIVGVAAGLAWLEPASVTASSVAVGHGSVWCAHGRMPVPSPAALEILREAGAVIEGGGVAKELCTPTGAAIVAATVTQWAPMPALVPLAIGYGAGDLELADRPNVVRLTVGRVVSSPRTQPGSSELGSANAAGAEAPFAAFGALYRLEANIDDMPAELCEHAQEQLLSAGALEVWWTSITMKKSRPAWQLSALVPVERLEAATAAVLRETTSIGVRFDLVERRVLEREVVEVETRFGRIAVKRARLAATIVNAAPEYEACRAAARANAVPLKQVYAAAVAAHEALLAT